MNQAAKAKIQELLNDTGHVLCVDDLDDINLLNEATEKIANSQTEDFWPLLDRPVIVGNMTLHCLTIGAHLWMIEFCQRAQDEQPEMWNTVIAYALAHAEDLPALEKITNSATPWLRLRMWAFTVRATTRGLERAFHKLLPGYGEVIEDNGSEDGQCTPPNGGDSTEKTYGSMIAFLTREVGATPDYWMWHESIETIGGYIEDAAERARRENAAAQKATHKRGHQKPKIDAATHMAIQEAREIENRIRAKWLTIE